ncbi:Uncharacterised protein [Klebsiella pneumoniae]|uniref:Uncharacterized protein n=1 Tax=Klebsiella pneumoniae TaxID=573 RepID=A0A377TZM5_KLEPN|nr:Uncharacterised protein [Klebsiella pneumoniae]
MIRVPESVTGIRRPYQRTDRTTGYDINLNTGPLEGVDDANVRPSASGSRT